MSTRAAKLLLARGQESLGAVTNRLRAASTLSSVNPPVAQKFAAVLVPLFEGKDGEVRVLLCRRASSLSTHAGGRRQSSQDHEGAKQQKHAAGEVALPGGKRDETDRDDIHTALREAEEELGIQQGNVEVLGKMKPFLSKHFLSVTPVIGRVPSVSDLNPNPAEVDAVFDVPLHTFLSADPAVYSFRDTKKSFGGEINYRLHFFQCGEFLVWGLTAGILVEAARMALGRDAEFETMPPGSKEYTEIVYDPELNRAAYRQPE